MKGDFNDILNAYEKVGGIPRTMRSMLDFHIFFADTSLLDLGFIDYPFTWRNQRFNGCI